VVCPHQVNASHTKVRSRLGRLCFRHPQQYKSEYGCYREAPLDAEIADFFERIERTVDKWKAGVWSGPKKAGKTASDVQVADGLPRPALSDQPDVASTLVGP